MAEEFLLLTAGSAGGTRDSPVVDLPEDRLGIRFAMTGAALMELSLRDRVETDVDRLWVCDPRPTGEPAIDPVLVRLLDLSGPNGGPRPIAETIKELDGVNSYQLALGSLRSRGLVGERTERVLGVIPMKAVIVIATDVVRAIRQRIHDVLFTGEIPDPRDACLISLLDGTKKFRRVVAPERVPEAIARTRRYSSLDLVGRNVAVHVTGMIDAFSKYGDIV